jgi:hypothetical protein
MMYTHEDFAEIGAALVALIATSQMLGHDSPTGSIRYVGEAMTEPQGFVLDAIGSCIPGKEGDVHRARLAASADSEVKRKIASAVMW